MGTILLVEDDPDIRDLIAYKLAKAGFDIVQATDGIAALELARQHHPDLVILDVRMPRLSGLEVCRELRTLPATAKVPIIMLTARTRPQDLEQARAAGASDYMSKPFSPRELQERVESVLQRAVP